MLPTKFWFIWLSSLRGEDFLEINQLETLLTGPPSAIDIHVCVDVEGTMFNLI